jgi:predicted O-methyltransferase YrrM
MNSLQDARITNEVASLLERAQGDAERWAARRIELAGAKREGRESDSESLVRLGEIFMSVSGDEGRLLYQLARMNGAHKLVEFGSSFGVSTLFLGAAARDNGGMLVTTEVHPDKCVAVLESIERAGLSDNITLLEGDARETLAECETGIDFLFLDGWKRYYLPMLEMLRTRLAERAVVAADNIAFEEAQNFVERVRDPDSGFVSSTIGQMEVSLLVSP